MLQDIYFEKIHDFIKHRPSVKECDLILHIGYCLYIIKLVFSVYFKVICDDGPCGRNMLRI